MNPTVSSFVGDANTTRLATVVADDRWVGDHGVGRFARELIDRTGMGSLSESGELFSMLSPMRLNRAVKRSKASVFYSPGFMMPWPIPAGVVCVPTLHDLIHLQWGSGMRRLYYERVLKPAVCRAPVVVTVSEYSKHRIAEWARIDSSRVVVVPNGVSESFCEDGTARDFERDTVLYVGNQKAHKNLDGLFAGLARLGSDCPMLAMSGSIEPETSKLIATHGIGERIQWLGHLSDDDLAEAYRGAGATVLVSHEEGFGLPVLESMACGTPVVVSSAGALREVTGNAGVVVEADDPDSIAQGIRDLLSDPGAALDYRSKGLARAQDFSWERSAELLTEALAPLLD